MGRRRERRTANRRLARAESQVRELIAEAQARRLTGEDLTPWELPIVVACRRTSAEVVQQLPMVTMRDRRPLRTQPFIVTHPDPFEPTCTTMQRVVNNLTKDGRCWLVPTAWDASGWPNALRVHDANQGAPLFDSTTQDLVKVSILGTEYGVGKDGAIWLPFDVPHRGHAGQGPIAGCWRAVEYLSALYDMAGSFWEAGFPSVAVLVGHRINDDDATRLKEQVLGAWARRHEPAVIDNQATLGTVGTNAVESQLVESIAVANQEVARAFLAMPSIVNVGGGDSLTYSTTEGEFRKWLAIGLGGLLKRIESGWNQLTPYGQEIRFDTNELRRADTSDRFAAWASAIAAGWMTIDEVRDREGLDPLYTPLDRAPTSPMAGDTALVAA